VPVGFTAIKTPDRSRARQPRGEAPHEIAPLAVFLAGDESTFVTGQAYNIDSGITI
jgi:2-keto-3-deoxy-L-fuconate dehydrogenase